MTRRIWNTFNYIAKGAWKVCVSVSVPPHWNSRVCAPLAAAVEIVGAAHCRQVAAARYSWCLTATASLALWTYERASYTTVHYRYSTHFSYLLSSAHPCNNVAHYVFVSGGILPIRSLQLSPTQLPPCFVHVRPCVFLTRAYGRWCTVMRPDREVGCEMKAGTDVCVGQTLFLMDTVISICTVLLKRPK